MTIPRLLTYTILVAAFACALSALAYRTGRIDSGYFFRAACSATNQPIEPSRATWALN